MTAEPKPKTQASPRRFQILVCDGPSCGVTHESEFLVERLQADLQANPALAERVTVTSYCCFGRCEEGPNMFVRTLDPDDDPHDEPDVDVFDTQRGFYPGMDEDKVLRVLRTHCGEEREVDDLIDDY